MMATPHGLPLGDPVRPLHGLRAGPLCYPLDMQGYSWCCSWLALLSLALTGARAPPHPWWPAWQGAIDASSLVKHGAQPVDGLAAIILAMYGSLPSNVSIEKAVLFLFPASGTIVSFSPALPYV
ncbi:hypothetical protein L7F22_049303 [Adiantum nelumboides]|nr:hypothetical protein [Adiantum nelumboides]